MLGGEVSDDRTEVGQEAEDELQASRRWREADRDRATADNEGDTRQHSELKVQSNVDSEAVKSTTSGQRQHHKEVGEVAHCFFYYTVGN